MRRSKNRCSHWLSISVLLNPDGTVKGVEMNRRTSEAIAAASWRMFKSKTSQNRRCEHESVGSAIDRRISESGLATGREEALSLSHCAALGAIQLERPAISSFWRRRLTLLARP